MGCDLIICDIARAAERRFIRFRLLRDREGRTDRGLIDVLIRGGLDPETGPEAGTAFPGGGGGSGEQLNRVSGGIERKGRGLYGAVMYDLKDLRFVSGHASCVVQRLIAEAETAADFCGIVRADHSAEDIVTGRERPVQVQRDRTVGSDDHIAVLPEIC